MLNLGVPPVENSDTCTCKALKPFSMILLRNSEKIVN